MAQILFVHRRGPGQFVHLAAHLAQHGHQVTLLSETFDRSIAGVQQIAHRPVGPSRGSKWAVEYQTKLGTSAAETMDEWRQRGGSPDLIFGHAGWGSLLFAKNVFPDVPLLAYCEHYYRPKGADVGFDPADKVGIEEIAKLKARNFAQATTLLTADAGVSPTRWQQSGYPQIFTRRIGVLHDGIDTEFCRPDPAARFQLPNGHVLQAGDKVITYAARNLEPYRGFPQFMRAAARLAASDPAVSLVVAGADGASYGSDPKTGRSWREQMMRETGMDASRIHFLGTVPHPELMKLFQVSAAHVYLTYPFVLSWSMLEAMAAGVLLIGSHTAPVSEFVRHDKNGLLVPFFDTDSLVATMREALLAKPALAVLRAAARRTVVEQIALPNMLAKQSALLGSMFGTQAIWN